MFKEVDHIAIVVSHTDTALTFYRDQMGLPELYSEVLDGPGVRLTHLDMGNVRLQLVQPLTAKHPLSKHLDEHGEGFHHVCWKVDDIDGAMQTNPPQHRTADAPRSSNPQARAASSGK
ncbi:MAG: VOC family protein [Verrucomicrobiales bacterium]